MSKTVKAVVEPTEKDKSYKKVWDTCIEAGVPAPVEIREFFNHVRPESLNFQERDITSSEHISPMRNGFDIDIKALVESGISRIRIAVPRGTPKHMAAWDIRESVTESWQQLSNLFQEEGSGYSYSTFTKVADELMQDRYIQLAKFNGQISARVPPSRSVFVKDLIQAHAEDYDLFSQYLRLYIIGYLDEHLYCLIDDMITLTATLTRDASKPVHEVTMSPDIWNNTLGESRIMDFCKQLSWDGAGPLVECIANEFLAQEEARKEPNLKSGGSFESASSTNVETRTV